MPLFRNSWDNQPSREPEPLPPSSPPKKRSGFLGSRRSADDSFTRPSNTYTNTRTTTYTNGTSRYSPTSSSSGGFFSRRRSFDDETGSDRSSGRSGKQISSIVSARQKVSDAESAERFADDALKRARNAVREAREHVRILENEALEE
jgi:hypothetical protein